MAVGGNKYFLRGTFWCYLWPFLGSLYAIFELVDETQKGVRIRGNYNKIMWLPYRENTLRGIIPGFAVNEFKELIMKGKKAGTGVALGIAIGTALGAAFDNLGVGIAVGLAIGAALDTGGFVWNRKVTSEEPESSNGQ